MDECGAHIPNQVHINEHKCDRKFKLGSNVNYRWMGSHLTREILENDKLNLRKLKEEVKSKFSIEVSMGQCKKAKQHACLLLKVPWWKIMQSYGPMVRR